jgi:CDP-4-dehydro-6-deoxyglucose reductase, E1
MRVPLASIGLRDRDIESAIEVLRSGNLTMGAKVAKFEEMMAHYLEVKHFVMVNSGSSANLAMVEALLRPTKRKPFLNPGDGVLVPAIAWPTTIWPLIQLNLKPYFVDVSIESIGMDLTKSQELIDNSKGAIKALFPIHPLGNGLDSKTLNAFADLNNLVLINDVCESLGSWDQEGHVGTAGMAGSFSFYFSHHITTMEGGGIATNDSLLADDLRSIRSHGWSRDRSDAQEWSRDLTNNDSRFLFVSTGYNIRPMEIQAAIGISQIQDIDVFIAKRRSHAMEVNALLTGAGLRLIGGETLKDSTNTRRHSWMMLPILIENGFKYSRREIIAILEKAGIETRPVLTGNFLNQPSMKRITSEFFGSADLKVSDTLTDSAFLIGNHHEFTRDQIDCILKALQEVLA